MTLRQDLFSQFNFVIELGTVQAGFQEVSGLGPEVSAGGSGAGSTAGRTRARLPSTPKASEVALRRGVVNAQAFEQWVRDVQSGRPDARTITLRLRHEDRSAAAVTWTIVGARIVKHTSGPLNAKGTDLAMEELVLAYDRLEME
jgi:phage tail-like protein